MCVECCATAGRLFSTQWGLICNSDPQFHFPFATVFLFAVDWWPCILRHLIKHAKRPRKVECTYVHILGPISAKGINGGTCFDTMLHMYVKDAAPRFNYAGNSNIRHSSNINSQQQQHQPTFEWQQLPQALGCICCF